MLVFKMSFCVKYAMYFSKPVLCEIVNYATANILDRLMGDQYMRILKWISLMAVKDA